MSASGDRHLSDEELSDLVDGNGATGSDGEEHVAGCASCAARLDGWRSVSRRLGSMGRSETVPAGRRDQAVAAAMAIAGTGGGGPAHTASPSTSASTSASASASSTSASGAAGRRRDLQRLGGLAAAAAVVAGVAVGVAHLGHHATVKSADRGAAAAPRSSGSASPASRSSNAPSFAPAPSAAGAQSGAGGSSPGAAGGAMPLRRDFGSLGGPAAVAAAVDRALASGTGAGAGAEGGAISGTPASAAPASGAPVFGGTAAPCPDTAKLFPGTSPRLLLAASALYRGTPAEVYAYRVGVDRRAVVMAIRGCALLADVALGAGFS